MTGKYDTIIVGGGFYGLRIAQFLKDELKQKKVLVIEVMDEPMQRASYNNQARVHSGYHYPRSVLTALRSKVNFPVFADEYKEAIVSDFSKYYAVARSFSKVSATQFRRFFERIDAELVPDKNAKALFNKRLVEEVYKVREYAFDAEALKKLLLKRLARRGIEVHTSERAEKVTHEKGRLILETDKDTYTAGHVINTTYSSINFLNHNSGLPLLPLKHELTEVCLIKVPPQLEGKAFTVMCGPFFSIMPFPAKNIYSLTHVRYTPHSEWYQHPGEPFVDNEKILKERIEKSQFHKMHADTKRYIPLADKLEYTGESLWEVKTVLPKSDEDDSRPILYSEGHGGLKNYICILGGKIDNIYDTFTELRKTYET